MPRPRVGGTAAREASILHIANSFTEAIFAAEEIEVWARKVDPDVWLEAGLSALVSALLPGNSGRPVVVRSKPQAVIRGNGPCTRERLEARRAAHDEGAWVREAASAYAAKQRSKQASAAA